MEDDYITELNAACVALLNICIVITALYNSVIVIIIIIQTRKRRGWSHTTSNVLEAPKLWNGLSMEIRELGEIGYF